MLRNNILERNAWLVYQYVPLLHVVDVVVAIIGITSRQDTLFT